MRKIANADRCVCCGEIIPEGRMVCPNCEEGSKAKGKRLIDANALAKKFRDHKDLFLNKMGGFQSLLQREKGRVDELDNCIADVINAPTVDAVEVVHGRWIPSKSMALSDKCSVCHGWVTRHSVNERKYRYCPNCGADMRERKEEE